MTSRPNGEDLDVEDDDLETRPSDIVTPPRKATSGSGKSASGTTSVPNGNGSDHKPRGAVAASDTPVHEPDTDGLDGASPGELTATAQPENGRGAAADATVVDGVPALPGDNLRPSRGSRPKNSSPDPGTSQSVVDDSPTFSFDRGRVAPVSPGTDDRTATPPAESSAEDSSWTTPSSPAPSRPGLSGAEPGRDVSPAAFAWEMPDPPASSPSSPARNFLRAETDTKLATAAAAASAAPDAADTATKTPPDAGPAISPGRPRKSSKRSARQAHLTVARVEPWSVMKFSFVLSLVAFVILFVAVSVLYGALSALGVFESLQKVVSSVTSSQGSTGVNAAKWWSSSRVLGYTALLGSLNIVLITAMATIGAVVYNLTSRLVGGVEVTLRETE